MKDFLKNLKNSLDNADFNSDAAKRINLIDEKANNAKGITKEDEEKVKDLIKTQAVDEKDVGILNSEYEKKMQIRKKEEIILATVATLINYGDEITQLVEELSSFVKEQKEKYNADDDDCKVLYEKINELESKYKLNKKDA